VTGLFYAFLSLIPLCIAVSGGFHHVVSACSCLLDFPCALSFITHAAVHPFVAVPVRANLWVSCYDRRASFLDFRIIFVLLILFI
jgi:hypothetical protein